MKRAYLFSSAILAASGLVVSPANASEADAATSGEHRLDAVVVTAQKQEQALIDVPINVSVADQRFIDLINADDIEEFADFVPGLQVQAQSLNTSSYSLRGVTSDGGRPRVAIFTNDVATGNPRFGSNLAVFDMERIEVVKGPQATLFGQGALVGGINFLQNKASTAGNEGYAKLDLGELNYVRGEAGYNYAVDDTLAFRVAGLHRTREGYVPNESNSPDLMGQDVTAIRVATHWEPTADLTADVFANYQEDESTGTQFKSGVFPPSNGDLSPYGLTAMNINGDQLRDELGNDREIFSVTGKLAYELGDAWTLTSVTDYRDIYSLEAFDSDGAAFDLLQFGLVDKGQAFSQELRMNFDGGGPLSAFFGANYADLNTSQQLRLSSNEAHAQGLLAPRVAAGAGLSVAEVEGLLAAFGVPGASNLDNIIDPLQYSALGALLQYQQTGMINTALLIPLNEAHLEEQFTNENTTSYDLFADLTYDVTERLSLTAGIRYTQEELSADTVSYLIRGNPALGGQMNAVTFGSTILGDRPGELLSRSYDADGALTWRFNAAYRINQDLNTWLAIGRGRRPEALTADGTEKSGFAVVSEEVFDSVELGMTGNFLNNRARMTSSIYFGEYKDFQTSRFDAAQGTFVTENSGNATQYGLEFEGRFLATDSIEVFGSYAYNFSEYDDEDDDGNALAFAGNQFRLSPENSLSIGADMRYPVAVGEVYFVPTYVWKDDHYFEDDNDPVEFQEAYGLVDLKLGFDHASGVWGASIYVENATDEDYLIDAGNTGGSFGIPTFTRGVPRLAGAGAYFKF